VKENAALFKENDEQRRRVPSFGSGSKDCQDDSRVRSHSLGSSDRAHSRRESSSVRHFNGSKK
jgi:hypothetical protein